MRLSPDYRIIEATSGVQAFELAKYHNPSLVVCDMTLQETEGLELCCKLKKYMVTCHLPVILIAVTNSPECLVSGLDSGADCCLSQNYSDSVLDATIRNLIETRKRLKSVYTSSIFNTREAETTKTDEDFLRKSINLIMLNLNNSEFSVQMFAEEMCVSRSLLHKKLISLVKQSAVDFINTIRLQESTRMLSAQTHNISEVAYAVGYNDPRYFSRIFRKYYGKSPSEYVKEAQINKNFSANLESTPPYLAASGL
jgi:YesN/AraC family two-component response regulator